MFQSHGINVDGFIRKLTQPRKVRNHLLFFFYPVARDPQEAILSSLHSTRPALSQFQLPQHREIGLVHVVQERRAVDFEAPKL